MSDLLKRKEEFVQYSLRAFENHNNNLIEESAILARKAGEVAVKILFHKYKQKLPFYLNERSGLKELIHALKEHTNIPNQTINRFETLQLTGNKAAHDSSLSNSDLEYAINALKLLIVYFYESVFAEKIPSKLSAFINKKDNKEDLIREIKNLKKQIKNKSGETTDPGEVLQQKLKELENKIAFLEEQSTKQSLIADIKEPAATIVEIPDPVTETNMAPEPESLEIPVEDQLQITKPKRKRRIVLATTLLLFVVIGVVIISKFYSSMKSEEKTAIVAPLNSSDTVLRIGIFNFNVLSDNPVVKLPIEQDIEGYLKAIAIDNKVEIQIIKGLQLPSTNIDSIKNYCFKSNIHLALFGDITENKKGDSCLVKLNYQFSFKNQRSPFYGSLNLIKTDLANLSGYSVLKKESAVLMNFGVGVLYYSNGNYKKAASLIKNLYSDSRYLMMSIHEINAYIHFYIPDYEQAKRISLEYIKDFPDSAQGYVCYANTLITAKELKTSLIDSFLQLGEKANKNNAQLWYAKSLFAQHYLNDTDLVVKYSKRATELFPNDYDYIVQYGYFDHYKTGRFDSSIAMAKKALSLDSTRYEAYLILGECAFHQKNYLESITYLKKAAESAKRMPVVNAFTNIKTGTSFYKHYSATKELRFIDSAIHYYQKALEVNKTADGYSYLGSACLEKKDTLSFILNKTRSLQLNPSNFYAVEELAIFCFQSFHYESMAAYCNYLLKLQPDNTNAHTMLGFYYLRITQKKGDITDGLNHINLSLKYNNQQPFAWTCKGFYFQYLVNIPDSAIYCYKKAFDMDSNDTDALYGLAQSYLNKKDFDKALPYFKMCYQRSILLPETNVALAYCYLYTNRSSPLTKANLESAAFHAKNAYNLNPNSAEANYAMANIFVAGNNHIDATNYYNRAVSINLSFKNAGFEASLKKVAENNAKNPY